MSGFSADWLALREPADRDARAASVTATVIASLPVDRVVHIADLGCGTGSNVRFLAPRLGRRVTWHLLDHDASLLREAARLLGQGVETRVADLRTLRPGDIGPADLVTASALLDLVSEDWLADFVRTCRGLGAVVLVALNYDGRVECTPSDPEDAFVIALVNRHQRTDKGFGPALGPDSGARAAARLAEAGYTVVTAKSDWVIGPDRAALQRELIRGWAGAAVEIDAGSRARIDAWLTRRLAHVDAGRSHLIVGHDDVGGTLGIANR